MRRFAYSALLTSALGAILVPLSADAETVPPRGPVDPRVRVVAYNPDDVVKLHGYVGYQIHLQWAPGEEFVNLGAGDAGGFDVGSEKNHFFIKPKQEHVGTNLTVLTTMRAYHFDYTVSRPPANRSATKDLVYSVRFVYPMDEAARNAAEAQRRALDARMNQVSAAQPANWQYWYCGTPSLKPTSAYDDGVQTHLKFPGQAEFPAVFVKNDDGSESLLNFNVAGEEVVIHRVARRLVLRRGGLVGCVVNRAFESSGARTGTGTSVPGIQRETRGPNP